MMRKILTLFCLLALAGCANYHVVKMPAPDVAIVPETPEQIVARRGGGVPPFDPLEKITGIQLDARFRADEELPPPRVRVRFLSPEKISAVAEAAGMPAMRSQGHFRGLSYYDKDGFCVIVAPRPRRASDIVDFATLGHELTHCIWGGWHAQPDRYGIPHPRPAVAD